MTTRSRRQDLTQAYHSPSDLATCESPQSSRSSDGASSGHQLTEKSGVIPVWLAEAAQVFDGVTPVVEVNLIA